MRVTRRPYPHLTPSFGVCGMNVSSNYEWTCTSLRRQVTPNPRSSPAGRDSSWTGQPGPGPQPSPAGTLPERQEEEPNGLSRCLWALTGLAAPCCVWNPRSLSLDGTPACCHLGRAPHGGRLDRKHRTSADVRRSFLQGLGAVWSDAPSRPEVETTAFPSGVLFEAMRQRRGKGPLPLPQQCATKADDSHRTPVTDSVAEDTRGAHGLLSARPPTALTASGERPLTAAERTESTGCASSHGGERKSRPRSPAARRVCAAAAYL